MATGISAAQYVNKTIGVRVYLRDQVDKPPLCVVEQHKTVKNVVQDDWFGTLAYVTLLNISYAAYNAFGSVKAYAMPNLVSFFSRFDCNVIYKFDHKWFKDVVIPETRGKANIQSIVDEYDRHVWEDAETYQKYETYDWIVRLYVELRKMKLPVKTLLVPVKETELTTPTAALMDIKNAKYVDFRDGTQEMLIPAFKAVYPDAILSDGILYCRPSEGKQVDALGLESFTPDISYEAGMTEEMHVPELIEQTDDIYQMAYVCNNESYHKLTPEQKEFITSGGCPAILDPTGTPIGIGKSRLVGLGKICKFGKLEECIERVANCLAPNLTGWDRKLIYALAAGRIAGMYSEKWISRTMTGYEVRPASEKKRK